MTEWLMRNDKWKMFDRLPPAVCLLLLPSAVSFRLLLSRIPYCS